MELLVVLFIVGVLMALILPAVFRSRETARRAHCVSNLGNVGKAVLQFESLHQRLPASGSYQGDPDDPLQRGAWNPLRSWCVDLLPFLDQQPLADRWDSGARYFDPDHKTNNHQLSRTALPVFACPSDDGAGGGEPARSYVANGGFGDANSFRVAVRVRFPDGGMGEVSLDLNANELVAAWDTDGDLPRGQRDVDLVRQTGVFFPAYVRTGGQIAGGSIPLSAVRDGLSQTILLSENRWGRIVNNSGLDDDVELYSWAAPEDATFRTSGYICERLGRFLASCAAGRVNYDRANDRSTPDYAEQSINGPGVIGSSPWLASNHSGGVNIVMCDGSVRFLSEQVAGKVFAGLVSSDGTRLPAPLHQGILDEASF